MKNKLITLTLLLFIILSLTGCGNSNSKTLTCTVTDTKDGRTTTSDLVVKVINNEVRDMTLTLDITLPKGAEDYRQAMIYQLSQKTDKIYSTNNGLKAVFDMGSSYFNTLGITKDASYSELKEVLELQGYTCKE